MGIDKENMLFEIVMRLPHNLIVMALAFNRAMHAVALQKRMRFAVTNPFKTNLQYTKTQTTSNLSGLQDALLLLLLLKLNLPVMGQLRCVSFLEGCSRRCMQRSWPMTGSLSLSDQCRRRSVTQWDQ
jgi:hypothetical protein